MVPPQFDGLEGVAQGGASLFSLQNDLEVIAQDVFLGAGRDVDFPVERIDGLVQGGVAGLPTDETLHSSI
jgi:hypothetical protein